MTHHNLTKTIHEYLQWSSHNYQRLKAAQMIFNERMDKQILVQHTTQYYSEIKEIKIDTHNNRKEFQRHTS